MKNKMINILTVIFVMAVSSGFVAAITDLGIEPTATTVTYNDQLVISVNISSDDSVAGATLDVNFDPNVLEAVSQSEGGFLNPYGNYTLFPVGSDIDNVAGKVTFGMIILSPSVGVNGSGSLVDITFKAVKKNGVSDIRIGNILVSDTFGKKVNASSINNGTVNVVTIENVLINEFMVKPSAGDEWVELYNNDTRDINMSGWSLNDSFSKMEDIPADVIEAGGHYLVYINPHRLNDGSDDAIKLINEEGLIINEISYDKDNVTEDVSIGRIHDGLDDVTKFDVPTPNAPNNRLSTDDIADKPVDEDTAGYFIVTDEIGDPDNDDLTFEIIDENVNEVDCDIINGINVTLTPALNWNGVTSCTIEVYDGYGWANKPFNINVNAVNDAPVVDLSVLDGMPLNEDSGEVINLSDYVEDVDNLDEEINWSCGSDETDVIVIADNATKILDMVATNDFYGMANITCTAFDLESSAIDSFAVDIVPINDPPAIVSVIPDIAINEERHNDTVDLSLYFDDIDSSVLIYTAENLGIGIDVGIYDSSMLNVSGILDFYGDVDVNITAGDGEYGVSQIITVSVNNVNDRPYFNPALEYQLIYEGLTLTYDINASDVDGDDLSFSSNVTLVGGAIDSSGVLTWTPGNSHVGEHNINVVVCDNSGEANNCTSDSFVITVVNTNDAPTLGAIADQSVNEDSLLQFYLNGADIDSGNTLIYSCDLTALDVDKIDDTLANVTWIPTNDYVGNHSVNCTVKDAAGEEDSQTFTITVQNTNDDPVLGSIGDKTVVEGLLLTFTLSATDEDPTNDVLAYGTNASVGNFNLDSNTGLVTFTPVYADVGVYDILFDVSDGNGGKDEEIITLTVNSALEISDLDVTVDGNVYNNIGSGAVVDARPGSIVQADIELKNMINVDIRGITVNGALNTDLGLFEESSLIPNMAPQSTKAVTLEFSLPNIIGEKLYPLIIRGIGEDENHIMREVERIVYVNVTQKGDEVILEDINLIPSKIACVKSATLSFSITNKGKYDQINGNTIKITNEELGIDIKEAFSIFRNSTIGKSYTFDAITTQTGMFPIEIDVIWFYVNSIVEEVDLEIVGCIDVPDHSVEEDTTPPANWIDLWSYLGDPNYLPSYFTYAIESESNDALIDCWLNSNRYIDCQTPAANQSGYSDINVSVVDGAYVNYGSFRVTVTEANDPPVAYDVIGIKVDEDSSVVIELNCEDIDDTSLNYTPNNPSNGALSGSGKSRTYTPNADYNGADSFTYKCNDGEEDSNTATVNIMVEPVLDPPSIASFSPDYNPLIGDGVDQGFNVTVHNPDSAIIKIIWYVDGGKDGTGAIYTFNEATAKTYEVVVKLTDAAETEVYDQEDWSVTVSEVPVTNKFTGTILDVESSNVDAFTDLTIIKSRVGMIDFGNQPIDLSNVVDIDSNVIIEKGVIGINSNAPGFDVFKNHGATITMYGLSASSAPTIYYNGGFEVSGTNVCDDTTDPSCTNVEYDPTTGTLTFDVSHFTIFFLNNPPEITSSPITAAIVDEEYKYGVKATDPENDPLTYSLTIKPAGMVINNNIITWTPTNITKENVTVSVTDSVNTVTQSFIIEVKEGAKLIISDLDVKVGDEKDKDLQNGDKIGEKAKPGDKVKFDIEVENIYSKASDIEITDITVTVTIEGIDDGDDLEEDADFKDLDPGDDDSVTLEFDVPTLVKGDIYDVVIEVEGDEDGKDHEIRWELKLEVKKDKHELLIRNADLSASIIRCDRSPSLDLEVVNIGREDEDEVSIEISNTELGIEIKEEDIEIEEGDDEDSVFKETYRLKIDSDARPGTYPITVKAYYDSKTGDQKTLDLIVEKCVEAGDIITPVKIEPVEVIPTIKPTTKPTAPVTKISFRETSEYLTLLAILFVILLGGVIFLIGAMVIMVRKR